jgi:hypothetical protein
MVIPLRHLRCCMLAPPGSDMIRAWTARSCVRTLAAAGTGAAPSRCRLIPSRSACPPGPSSARTGSSTLLSGPVLRTSVATGRRERHQTPGSAQQGDWLRPKEPSYGPRTVMLSMSPHRRVGYLNQELVKQGWCWWYRKYAPGDRVLEGLEKEARELWKVWRRQ